MEVARTVIADERVRLETPLLVLLNGAEETFLQVNPAVVVAHLTFYFPDHTQHQSTWGAEADECVIALCAGMGSLMEHVAPSAVFMCQIRACCAGTEYSTCRLLS